MIPMFLDEACKIHLSRGLRQAQDATKLHNLVETQQQQRKQVL
jgi:hypothetical protein